MLVSFKRLAGKTTDQFASQICRASFNNYLAISYNMETKQTRNGPCGTSYEDAVKALHNLQSNAETIAKARQNANKNAVNNISNMIKYILRSGLKMEDVDKLSVIHVSGTKGKGSTCAFCERILYCHGYKTGLFTSPHMIEVRERIRINGRPISQELFSKYFWKVYNNLQVTQTKVEVGAKDGGGMPPYFAFLTVLSLHVFLSEGVDVAVVEVGIGGQYDSTNFFRQPIVCGVTSLGLDHTSLLGNTITEIAWNKAGIFKLGRPAITVQHEQAAMEVLRKRAHEIQNPLYIAKEMPGELIQKENIKLGIAGTKQSENASLAIQLFRMWKEEHSTVNKMIKCVPTAASSVEDIPLLKVSELDDATLKGLSTCMWPGRAQTITRGDVTYYLDGAHTKESMEVCVQWFKQATKKEICGSKRYSRILLFNATSDRDAGSLLACLTGCNFDAALFCTNMLSTVETFNRADQLNKTVTPKWMIEKVDVNKSVWDELMDRQQSAVVEDCDIDGHQPEILCYTRFPNYNSVTPNVSFSTDSKVLLNDNLGRTYTEISKEIVHNIEMDQGCESFVKKFKVSHNGTFVDSQSDYVYQSENQVRLITQNNSTTDDKNTLKETENYRTLKETERSNMLKEVVNNSGIAQDTCLGMDLNLSRPLSNGTVSLHSLEKQRNVDLPLSMKFSCILHALEWATQGRDPLVKTNDPEFVLPSIPNNLRDADHLQILITGSLHLVGGVLGVVDPQMND